MVKLYFDHETHDLPYDIDTAFQIAKALAALGIVDYEACEDDNTICVTFEHDEEAALFALGDHRWVGEAEWEMIREATRWRTATRMQVLGVAVHWPPTTQSWSLVHNL